MKSTMQVTEMTIKCPGCDNIFTTTDFNLKYDEQNNRLEAYYISCGKCGSDFTPTINLNQLKGE